MLITIMNISNKHAVDRTYQHESINEKYVTTDYADFTDKRI